MGRFKLRSPVPSESTVLRACLKLLRLRGVHCWRNNTGAAKVGDRFIRFGTPGSSDILGLLPDGRFLAIEVKRPGERPTPLQLAFLRAVIASRGVGVWVDSSRQLDTIINHVLASGAVVIDPAGAVAMIGPTADVRIS